MGSRLKIGVDVDEVVVDFVSAFKKEAEAYLGRQLPEPINNWDLPNDWSMSKRQEHEVWERIKATENWFYLYLNALPGVAESLPWLTSEHEVYFVTARVQTAGFTIQKQTQMHLADLGVQFPQVIVARDKGPIVAALGLDVFIDDKPKNLESIQAASPKIKLYLMDPKHAVKSKPTSWQLVTSFKEFCSELK